MTYCNGKSKGRVTFIYQKVTNYFEVTKTPFDVTCTSKSNCGVSGNVVLTYTVPSLSGSYNYSFSGFQDETYFFKSKPAPTRTFFNNGLAWDLYGNCAGVERLILVDFSVDAGYPTITDKKFTATGAANQTIIKIYTNGQLIGQVPADDCNFSVGCDDGCPKGQMKCQCTSYPGYCCIPCNDIKSEIKSIVSTLRSQNRG